MALNVYIKREDVPKGMTIVDSNKLFFDNNEKLSGSDFKTWVLEEIDKAKRVS